ncbi:hypothetical protein OXB_0667 [Bacillus sp. OxB-1]|uniref:hypothetical protein n=1 Tax=Bacillus sp. (strain OxB-1) TaxID=98228 RepID=UPI000581D814|nr:hypothetical protein [Bacillus sp. OxB-1]BAQ09139.1 hypothetical protein OXB_0667 [Bacillus sp. OxB-1]
MKRYWKIISICLVTLLVIGTFYTHSSFAANKLVEIEFEKVSGNEDEVKNIMIDGVYWNHMSQPIHITNGENKDPNHQSFLQKLDRIHVPPMFDKLVKQQKNFMRSKDLVSTNFFEDENLLAYANVTSKTYVHPAKDLSFDIEVLNKETKESTALRIDVPEREDYVWMQVEAVQVVGGELKVITQGYRKDSKGEYQFHVYTIDVEEGKLVSDNIIASTPTVKNGWSDMQVINNVEPFQRFNYLLIRIEAFEEELVQSDGQPTTVASEYLVYNIEKNRSEKLVGPDDILATIDGASTIINSTIYVPSQAANGLEVNRYDIETGKWDEKLTFDLPDSTGEEQTSYSKVMNGKIYIVYATSSGQALIISDLPTGESLYEGKLKLKHQQEDHQDFQLYINEIGFTQ